MAYQKRTGRETGPVDPYKPLYLDDGRQVTLREYTEGATACIVLVKGNYERDGDETPDYEDTWAYSLTTGVWCSGRASTHYVLTNTPPPPHLSPTQQAKRKLWL